MRYRAKRGRNKKTIDSRSQPAFWEGLSFQDGEGEWVSSCSSLYVQATPWKMTGSKSTPRYILRAVGMFLFLQIIQIIWCILEPGHTCLLHPDLTPAKRRFRSFPWISGQNRRPEWIAKRQVVRMILFQRIHPWIINSVQKESII